MKGRNEEKTHETKKKNGSETANEVVEKRRMRLKKRRGESGGCRVGESEDTEKHAGCSAWLLPLCLRGEQLRRERRRRQEGGGPGEVVGELRMKTEGKEGEARMLGWKSGRWEAGGSRRPA